MAPSSALNNALLLTVLGFGGWLLVVSAAKGPANDYVQEIVRENGELRALNDYLVDFAQLEGFVFIDKEHQLQRDPEDKGKPRKILSNHFSVTAPLTVFPSPFPKDLFNEAWELQELMARVHLRVSLNYGFLKNAMADVAQMNPEFIGKLVKIMETVKDNRKQSGMTLLIQRSDYLTHLESAGNKRQISIKQIEVSTGVHAGQAMNPIGVHDRVLAKIAYDKEAVGEPVPEWIQQLKLRPDNSAQGQAMAFYRTWLEFTTMHKDTAAIILLINPSKRSAHSHFQERNWVQFTLEDIARREGTGRPRVADITFEECPTRLTFVDGHVFLDKHQRVAIIFHGGYLPAHFSGEKDWDIRLQMEQSEAVMVPNVFTFLAGTKKVQQVLSGPGQLEQFFPELKDLQNPEATPEARKEANKLRRKLNRLRATFIEMHGLGEDSEEEIKLLDMVIANSDDYVLKENLEGGKGNHFGKEMKKKLQKLKEKGAARGRSVFILQKIIRPLTVKNAISPEPPATADSLKIVDVNSELSIFGALLAKTNNIHNNDSADLGKGHGRGTRTGNGNASETDKQIVEQKIVFNTVDGYCARTKVLSNTMCNLCGGMGGLDSLALFPMSQFKVNAKTPAKATAEGGDEEEHCAAAGDGFKLDENGNEIEDPTERA